MLLDRSTPVLLVEDRATTARIITDMLRGLGFENFETVGDGATALEILAEKGSRLVIADLHMEPMSGLQLLRSIRADDKLKRTPFIMTMATLSPDEATAIKSAGADSFILKPFKPHALEAKIEAVLTQKGSVKENVEKAVGEGRWEPLARVWKRSK